MPHDHSHSHCHSEAHSHDHDHSHDPPPDSAAAGDQFSLWAKVDRENVVAANAVDGEEMGRRVIKPWDQRDDETEWCESDADDSLIISIPFTAQVKLRSITLKCGPAGQTPTAVHLFVNQPGLDFNDASEGKPAEKLDLVVQKEGVEYAVRPSKFSQVRSLQLFFPHNISHGDDEECVRIYYVGLKGEWTDMTRNPEGLIVYEANANPADHKVKGESAMAGSRLGM